MEAVSGMEKPKAFCVWKAGVSRGKAADVEAEIVAELEKGNYHTRQQIADMTEEKFHISMSVSAIGRFLKKTVYGS